jgi:protein phosphatase
MWKRLSSAWQQMTHAMPHDRMPDDGRLQTGGEPEASANAGAQRSVLAPAEHLCGITDAGRVRNHNEDSFHLSADGRLMIVADGMGGHQSGEVASALSVQGIVEFLESIGPEGAAIGPEAAERLLRDAFDAAHVKVMDATQDSSAAAMGATLIVAWVVNGVLYTCHVGDVRCYVRTASTFEQITQDHSVVGELVRAGQLTPDEARMHPSRNEVLQAIGMPHGIVPDVNVRPLQPGDRILLCSDGLWEVVSDYDICSIVDWDAPMRQRAAQLVDRANAAGGPDNVTVVLYEHQPAARSST